MKVNLAKSAGFCFGVKRAIDIAHHTINSYKNVYMLGDIVHNEEVEKQIEKSGIKKVKRLSKGKERVFLIRAHGAGIKLVNKARGLGYKIIDATCPMVKEIHKIATDMEKKGYAIIVIGDKRHNEVLGITGQLKNKAIVIDERRHIPLHTVKRIKKACVVAQSTQNLQKVMGILEALKPHIKELKFFNTICGPTRMKQEEIKKLPLENDAIIIIGSKTSANTKRLYEISRSINEKSFWIQTKKDINPAWFRGAKNVGVTAGASTPDKTIKETVEYIQKI